MQEKISIILPIYNVKPYLDRSLQAVCGQTYTNLEILLIDDGSTDGSGEICDAYARQDDRIRVYHKENGGSSTARNLGIEKATGAYVGFLDSDDWAEPDMYETLYLGLSAHPDCTVAQMMSRDFDADGNLVKGPYKEGGGSYEQTPEEYFRELMLYVGDSSFCTKLFRREFLQGYRFSEHRLNEDFELLLRMTPALGRILTIEKLGYNIELRSGSNTRGKYNPALYEAMIRNAELSMEMAEQYFPAQREASRHFYQVQCMWYLLHVPVEKMGTHEELYVRVMRGIRPMRGEIRRSRLLRKEYRKNLLLLTAVSPIPVRRLHGLWMRIRDGRKE